MRSYYVILLFFLFITSCSKEKNEEDIKDDDPWSELRDLSPGDVLFDGDYFCYYDCANDKVLCGQRSVCDCDVSNYHPEFLSYDCFFITEFNGGDPTGEFEKGDEFGAYFLVCFCGRSNNTYSGTYTMIHNYSSCDDLYDNSPRDNFVGADWDGSCEDDCNPCIKNCIGRLCGPDGCGGSCGTCPPGKTCSTSGICIDIGTNDPCSDCLSTCRGIPGCCTGCGCLCEDECGGCF